MKALKIGEKLTFLAMLLSKYWTGDKSLEKERTATRIESFLFFGIKLHSQSNDLSLQIQ